MGADAPEAPRCEHACKELATRREDVARPSHPPRRSFGSPRISNGRGLRRSPREFGDHCSHVLASCASTTPFSTPARVVPFILTQIPHRFPGYHEPNRVRNAFPRHWQITQRTPINAQLSSSPRLPISPPPNPPSTIMIHPHRIPPSRASHLWPTASPRVRPHRVRSHPPHAYPIIMRASNSECSEPGAYYKSTRTSAASWRLARATAMQVRHPAAAVIAHRRRRVPRAVTASPSPASSLPNQLVLPLCPLHPPLAFAPRQIVRARAPPTRLSSPCLSMIKPQRRRVTADGLRGFVCGSSSVCARTRWPG
ncbi:hypothetical protein OF83DRAFT_247290 [Amylostereum chailletii]|nr:hypothetical protein OF83DRAFT_247290 [Amylostereum chailletii]